MLPHITPIRILCAAMIVGILFCSFLILSLLSSQQTIYAEARFVLEAITRAPV